MKTGYDEALYYLYRANWNELIKLMVNTEDDMFSKKIEHFLHAFKYERNLQLVDIKLRAVLDYIEHACTQLETENPLHSPAFMMQQEPVPYL
ncbi:MAG: YhdB family protein [Bacilli bacterium]